jgi:Mrp family chromosome partitioning ATPase/uncharacterized protein involved in exopolysaccharide biosynthesis
VSESTSQLELYLAAAKRQWWVVLQAAVVVGIVAAIFATREPDPPYRAATSFLVKADYDVNGRPTASFAVTVSSQARNLTSPSVLDAAAKELPGETPASIASTLGSSTDTTAGTITLTVTADEPDRPVPIANAVANAFIEDRRQAKTAALQAVIDDYDVQLQELESRMDELNQQIDAAAAAGQPTSILESRLATTQNRADTIYANKLETQTQIALSDPGVAVLTPAGGASQAEKPSPIKRGLLGAGIGLVIGIALAAVRETLDSRVRSRAGVEHLSGLTVVAELPEERIRSKRNELPIVDQPAGSLAEAIRGLRTTLRYLGATQPIRSLVVTSPQSGDGKTMTAANLAASFAASGISTVLVSGDLRRPGVDEQFDLHGCVGLSDVLAGTWPGAPTDDDLGLETHRNGSNGAAGGLAVRRPEVTAAYVGSLLRPTKIDGLSVLPAGRVPPNPSELLSTDRAAQTFAALGEIVDMVIVDSPPTIVADSAVLAGLVDSVLLVVALDRTRRGALRKARQALDASGRRVVGVALNRVRNGAPTYSGYYYTSTGRADARR